MRIDAPAPSQIPQLRELWKEAFGDTDAYLDLFFGTAYSPDRCRCVTIGGQVASALYWFNCRFDRKPVAYVYAVATAQTHRHQGLAAALLQNTHRHLKESGYAGAILVPASASLFDLYEKQGYHSGSEFAEFHAEADGSPLPLKQLSWTEYVRLRTPLLPQNAVLQDSITMEFLAAQAQFYQGQDCLLCATKDGDTLLVKEFLGDPAAAPRILSALGASEGMFRTPGKGRPFTMFCPLLETDQEAPSYFAFALD